MLDYSLVPAGLMVMLGYHIWLLFLILKHPNKTVIGVNSVSRRYWVRAMMEDTSKNGVLSVQTLRNNIMASSVLASACIMLSSAMAVLMNGKYGERPVGVVFGDKTALGISIKCFAILLCLLLSFLLNLQSIRYLSLASILINVPKFKNSGRMQLQQQPYNCLMISNVEYVGATVNRGSYFWSLGLRAFYFSFPLFLWIFGPIPMFLSSLLLVLMLYLVDISFETAACPFEEIHPAAGNTPDQPPPPAAAAFIL